MGISYSKDSKNSIVKNKQQQLSNSKIERLFVTSIIKFDIIFVILSGYWEHYPSRVNCATFSATLMSLEISSITYLPHPSYTWDKNFDTHTPRKKNSQVAAKLWCSFLEVECLYGDSNLYKLQVHSIFAILARGVFRTQLNTCDRTFCKNN